jgi:hypothetical protein
MILNLVLGLAMLIIGYLIMPKKQQKQEIQPLEAPTSEAGKPIPVLFGEMTIKSGNFLWWGDAGHATKTKKTKKK